MSEARVRTRLEPMRWLATHLLNPITRHFVHWLPSFAIISYRGRRSGKTYRTPMNVFRDGDSYLFALTYGPEVHWVKNVLASGEADLQVRNHHLPLDRPAVFEDPTRHLMPQPVRAFLGLIRVRHFLRMWPKAGPGGTGS
jgi:deazaflavin-dependent oxidoreductase (nitroreductase family)